MMLSYVKSANFVKSKELPLQFHMSVAKVFDNLFTVGLNLICWLLSVLAGAYSECTEIQSLRKLKVVYYNKTDKSSIANTRAFDQLVSVVHTLDHPNDGNNILRRHASKSADLIE
jgi:hypothetical protein